MDHAVESALAGGDDVEILIVDDGSSDDTAKIADRLEQEHPGIIRALRGSREYRPSQRGRNLF